jgi:hypothetical protein
MKGSAQYPVPSSQQSVIPIEARDPGSCLSLWCLALLANTKVPGFARDDTLSFDLRTGNWELGTWVIILA